MKTQCPHCKATFKAPDEYRGKKSTCPKCKQQFIIGGPISAGINEVNTPKEPPQSNIDEPQKKLPDVTSEISSNGNTESSFEYPDQDLGDTGGYKVKKEKIKCPFCDGEISSSAAKCQHCGEFLVEIDNMPNGQHVDANFFDRVLRLAFGLAKAFSAIVVIVCLLIAISSIVAVFFVKTNVENEKLALPTFAEYLKLKQEERQSQEQTDNRQAYSDTDNSDGFNSPSWGGYNVTNFDAVIEDLCDNYRLDKAQLLEWLRYTNVKHRDAFISGLSSFLSESKKHFGKNGSQKINYAKGALYYKSMFDEKLEILDDVKTKNMTKKAETGMIRRSLLIAVASALGLLLSFLILPLLIQIERNTRAN